MSVHPIHSQTFFIAVFTETITVEFKPRSPSRILAALADLTVHCPQFIVPRLVLQLILVFTLPPQPRVAAFHIDYHGLIAFLQFARLSGHAVDGHDDVGLRIAAGFVGVLVDSDGALYLAAERFA